jgi:hypothetical protein
MCFVIAVEKAVPHILNFVHNPGWPTWHHSPEAATFLTCPPQRGCPAPEAITGRGGVAESPPG